MARHRDPGDPFEVWHAAAGLWLLIRECRLPDGSTVSVGSDITGHKSHEAALLRAKEEAERANRAKSHFLANMSHELRTPLNAVIGFSDILRNESFGPIGRPRYREYAEDIWRSGNHLLTLINDVLDLSKIEAGRLELSEGEVDLRSVVASAVGMVAEQASSAGLTVLNMTPAVFPTVRADERAIRQVLINLLSNAVKLSACRRRSSAWRSSRSARSRA
jgi:signal transduction histidine kinase